MNIEKKKLKEIKPNPANPRVIHDSQFHRLVNSLLSLPKMLELRPIVTDTNMIVLGGNQRLRALQSIAAMSDDELKERISQVPDFQKKKKEEQDALVGFWLAWLDNPVCPSVKADELTDEEQRKFIIVDNAGFGEWDWDMLSSQWDTEELGEWGVDVPTMDSLQNDNGVLSSDMIKNELKDEFLIPPLSIIDTTKGEWQDRKSKWKMLGLKSEDGREDKMMAAMNRLREKSTVGSSTEESIFDPVLCELLYSWFCLKDGHILDPFAGGSVRGIVASFKDMQYTGIDIRKEQIEANINQIGLCSKNKYQPNWICGDSQNIDTLIKNGYQSDFLFSCPPYADLEVYSDIENDLSNMSYEEFKKAYSNIILKSCSILKNDRFACFVVGEVRNSKGIYYNFVSDTIKAFEDAGLRYYNEMILRTQVSAKALTCAKGMRATRKIGKIHQNILVFLKGDAKKAVDYLGDIDIDIPALEQHKLNY